MLFSKQKIFCNACGQEMYEVLSRVIGRHYRVCSMKCMREMEWRDTLSIMGEEYKPRPQTADEKDE